MQIAHLLLFALSFFLVANKSSETCKVLREFMDLQDEIVDDQRNVIANLSSNSIILGIHREGIDKKFNKITIE
jgi:hypothetical protein